MAPSMMRMRSASRCCSACARVGLSQGSVLISGFPACLSCCGFGFWCGGARLARDQGDHLEMGWAPFTGNGFAAADLEAGLAHELRQVFLAEAEIDVAIGADHATVFKIGRA